MTEERIKIRLKKLLTELNNLKKQLKGGYEVEYSLAAYKKIKPKLYIKI